MIAFACAHCGQKFQVKPQFAGRRSSCPRCKQALVVPAPAEPTQAYVPQDNIDGAASSLHQAGVAADVTLESHNAGAAPLHDLLARRGKAQRYVIAGEIARGGMGAVLRAVDCDIRREVAVKYMLSDKDPKQKLRFVEEAQITGQLEHPNIVPIHELGVDAQQRLFFSMKMVKGRSLAQVLDALRKEPKTAEKEWPLSRLLTVFVGVCNALAYAHSRNVVHRDLKPANIMLGDFGEVYVMDWGLAKVLSSGVASAPRAPEATVVTASAAAPLAVPMASASGVHTARSSKLDKHAEADLTQDGAILGTPVYMPPEQATGNLAAIDARSDVYSLGGILYELLTLEPPVKKEGGYLAVLTQVVMGEIVPPEQRAPERASKMPRELAAVAMKAMAKEPADRYASVEALRRDIERFQEGRSVSAKADTTREILWKLVKRNKAVSAALFVLLPALLWLLALNLKNSWAYAREQAEKEKRTKQAVPALIVAARQVANNGDFKESLEQISVVLDYDENNADAVLLRGQVFVAQKKFAAGRAELERYLKQRPNEADVKQLIELSSTAKADDPAVLFALAEVFMRQKAYGLGSHLLQDVAKSIEERKKLLPVYQKQIETAWPGFGRLLALEPNGQFSLALGKEVLSLHPLKGIPLHQLRIENDRIADLSPLKGMPLTQLHLYRCSRVRDLTPLKGIPLTVLGLEASDVQDLVPLRGMPLTLLNLNYTRVKDLTPLQGMPLTDLLLRNTVISDLSPLREVVLTAIDLRGCAQLSDLTPLQGMKLTELNLSDCSLIKDLLPLRHMHLTSLDLGRVDLITDLSPLHGMPLTYLKLDACIRVQDLTPLKGMPLRSLILTSCHQVRSIAPLEGMSLQEIHLPRASAGFDLGPLRRMKSLKKIVAPTPRGNEAFGADEFWKKYDAGEFNK